MSNERCIACGQEIAPGAPTYAIETFLDPLPPRGVACSERCKESKENQSKLRAMLWYNSPANPFGSGGDHDK